MRIDEIFECPECHGVTLEEVSSAITYTPIESIGPLGPYYGETASEETDVKYYSCSSCGWQIPNEEGKSINSMASLYQLLVSDDSPCLPKSKPDLKVFNKITLHGFLRENANNNDKLCQLIGKLSFLESKLKWAWVPAKTTDEFYWFTIMGNVPGTESPEEIKHIVSVIERNGGAIQINQCERFYETS